MFRKREFGASPEGRFQLLVARIRERAGKGRFSQRTGMLCGLGKGVANSILRRLKPMFHNVSRNYPIQSRVFRYWKNRTTTTKKNRTFEDLKVSEIMFSPHRSLS